MANATEFAKAIQRQLPNLKQGSLRFWGVWFGRPHDNVHIIVGAACEENCLRVRFYADEQLEIWNPSGLVADDDSFRIEDATRVRWSWRKYGAPSDSKRYYEEYTREGVRIAVTTNVDWYTPRFDTDGAAPAVEME